MNGKEQRYELAGTMVEIGPNVEGLKVGGRTLTDCSPALLPKKRSRNIPCPQRRLWPAFMTFDQGCVPKLIYVRLCSLLQSER